MPLETKLRRFSRWAAACAVALGVLNVVGYALDLPSLRNLFLTGRPMSLNSALCFSLYGIVLWLLSRTEARGLTLAARAVAGVVFCFIVGSWLELSLGMRWGFNSLFVPAPPSQVAITPLVLRGIFPLNTLVPLALLGAGLMAVHPPARARFSLSTWLGLAVLAVALLTLLGHILSLAGIAHQPGVAFLSALALAALGSGLAAVRANHDFLRIIASRHPINPIARRTLMAALVIPLLLYMALVGLVLRRAPDLQEELTMLAAVFGTGLLGLCVYGLHRLHLIDEQRTEAEKTRDILLARVQQQAATLQFEVAERTQELRVLHERMQFAVGSAGFGLWEYDFANRRLTWDDRTLGLYGIRREDFHHEASDWQRLVHPDDRAAAEQSTAAVLSGRANHYEANFRIVRPDGELRHIRAIGYLQRDPAGQVLRIVGLDKDVTRDREHQSALAELNERLQLALQAEGGGVWDFDAASDTTKWDRRQCEIYGVKPEEFDNRLDSWRRLVHPEDRSRVDDFTTHARGQGEYLENNFRIIRADGATRYVSSVGYIYRNAAGQVARIVGVDSDVTASVEMRDKLRLAEERLQLALQASGEGMWDWNVATGQVYYSPRWFEMLGYKPDELPQTISTWEQLIHPEDFAAAISTLQEHCQGRAAIYRSEHRLRTKGGDWIWSLSRGEVVSRDAAGQPLRVVGMQGDITERKLLEQQLRRNQEIALQVGRLAQIGAWEIDTPTQKVTWDPEVYRIHEVELGYEPTLVSAVEFYPPESRGPLGAALTRAEKDGTPFDLELPFVTARQRRLWVRVIGRAELSQGRVVRVFGAFQDITNRYEAEQARHRLETQLFQAQKMETLGTLAGGIAHDFNNLLTGIMGYQDLALDSLKPEEDAHHCVVAAREASFRARGLVDQILTFSRPAADSEPMSIDLTQVAEEARRFLRATVPASVDIQIEIHPPVDRVEADATQMHQVLLNLGSNAAHAMRLGGGELRIALKSVHLDQTAATRLGGLKPGRHVQMTVSDTGHGIDPETLKRIFDPFFTTKNVGEGTGLGLSVVHGIIRAHQGAIQVSSAPGQGARFDIYLAASEVASPGDAAAAGPPIRGQGEMICVVDDEQLVAGFSKTALARFGYQAVSFDSPDKCLEALRQDPAGCAVLVTDQTMPTMTGMELAAEVRGFAPNLPIIVMSGYFSKISPAALDQIGHISLLAKPFSVEEIAQAVHRALHPDE
jgi:PAS domain S-box-containing protein